MSEPKKLPHDIVFNSKSESNQDKEMNVSDYMVAFSRTPKSYCIGMVDLVDASKISASMNEKQWGMYFQVFLKRMSHIIERFGGFVIKNIGDSLLYYFPETSKPKRKYGFISCVECSLAMIEAHDDICKELGVNDLPCFDYRVSADYGQVVLMQVNNSSTVDLIGPPINMCAKINHKATKNGVVIGGDMHQMVSKLDDYHFKKEGGFSIGFKHEYPIFSIQRKN